MQAGVAVWLINVVVSSPVALPYIYWSVLAEKQKFIY